MIGTTGAFILVTANVLVGCVIGLTTSALILRRRLTGFRASAVSVLSSVTFLSATAWLNCSVFFNEACVDPAHGTFHNRLVDHALSAEVIAATITASLLSSYLLTTDHAPQRNQQT